MGVPVLNPFLVTSAQAFGRPVCRLGLASYGQTAVTSEDIHHALGRGVNFLNWQGLADGPSGGDAYCSAVASLGADRPSVLVYAQFGARNAGDAAVELKSVLAALGTDYIDVLTLYYVEQLAEWEEITSPGGALPCLQDAKRDGVVRRTANCSRNYHLAAKYFNL